MKNNIATTLHVTVPQYTEYYKEWLVALKHGWPWKKLEAYIAAIRLEILYQKDKNNFVFTLRTGIKPNYDYG